MLSEAKTMRSRVKISNRKQIINSLKKQVTCEYTTKSTSTYSQISINDGDC